MEGHELDVHRHVPADFGSIASLSADSAAPYPTDAWEVGVYDQVDPLIWHWDGVSWSAAG